MINKRTEKKRGKAKQCSGITPRLPRTTHHKAPSVQLCVHRESQHKHVCFLSPPAVLLSPFLIYSCYSNPALKHQRGQEAQPPFLKKNINQTIKGKK